MSLFTSPAVAGADTAADDPRVGHVLGSKVSDPLKAWAILLGFPSDEGVRRNGGRPGAAAAPDAIRQALYKLTPDAHAHDAFIDLLAHTVDLGNLHLAATMEKSQQRLGEVLEPYLRMGAVPIILGGGHETAYGHFQGYVQAEHPVAILNWDAHPDVRPLRHGEGHSGSPFREALDHPSGVCTGYTVAGLLPHSVARAHLDYLQAQGAHFYWRDELTPTLIDACYSQSKGSMMVTFDADAIDQVYAPGVSAPAVCGMAPNLWMKAAFEAGRCPRVTSVDVVEVNPSVDVGGQTVRLAALTVWHILRGLAERPSRALRLLV